MFAPTVKHRSQSRRRGARCPGWMGYCKACKTDRNRLRPASHRSEKRCRMPSRISLRPFPVPTALIAAEASQAPAAELSPSVRGSSSMEGRLVTESCRYSRGLPRALTRPGPRLALAMPDMTEKSKSKTLSTTTHAPVELEQVVNSKQ